jgi:SAM-dependent methyltransferase
MAPGRKARPQNRVLDLDELDDPFFRRVNEKMRKLQSSDPTRYLHPSKLWEYPWALGETSLPPGSRVLDAGCGGSIFPVYLSTLDLRVTAVDLRPPGIPAGHQASKVHYAAAELTRLPLKEKSFDSIFCISVLEHLDIQGMQASLQEMRRVLKPEGRLLLTTDYYKDRNAKLSYSGPGAGFSVDWNFFDREMLEAVVLNAPGFRTRGDIDLSVGWEITAQRMSRFHGYPYTSVGIVLVKSREG